jgi:DNA mismatch repair ATPase MutS
MVLYVQSGMVPAEVKAMTIVYYPQIGYLVQVDAECLDIRAEDVPGLQLQFFAEGQYFFKNDRTIELDARLGDFQAIIADMESIVVRELHEMVVAEAAILEQLALVLYEMDALMALAVASVELDLCRPVMIADSRELVVRSGHHIIQGKQLFVRVCMSYYDAGSLVSCND